MYTRQSMNAPKGDKRLGLLREITEEDFGEIDRNQNQKDSKYNKSRRMKSWLSCVKA